MNTCMKQLAIIGPTASGKSDLAIKIADKIDAHILSIDSLSIYKEIDIVSAKPSKIERQNVQHFGIDILKPDEYFSVDIFMDLYREVVSTCQRESKNLVIVGGTSFYLKSLMQGLSPLPIINEEISWHVQTKLLDLPKVYAELCVIDPLYMKNISSNDRYRIEKMLLIHEASNLSPTEWFHKNPPKPVIEDLDIYNIEIERNSQGAYLQKNPQNVATRAH